MFIEFKQNIRKKKKPAKKALPTKAKTQDKEAQGFFTAKEALRKKRKRK